MMKSFKSKAFFTALSLALGLCVASTATAQDGAAQNPNQVEQTDRAETQEEAGEAGEASDSEQAGSKGEVERPTMQETSGAGEGERKVTGGTLALVAYVALWILVFGFVVLVVRRQRRIDDELDELEGRLDRVFEEMDG